MPNPYFTPLGTLLRNVGWFGVAILILYFLGGTAMAFGNEESKLGAILAIWLTTALTAVSLAITIYAGEALIWEGSRPEGMAPFPSYTNSVAL